MTEQDLYRTLQVHPEADSEVITAAFRALARKLHPDTDITGVHQFRMADLNRAYAILRDPEKRRQYDAKLETERVAAIPVGPGPAAQPGTQTPISDRFASRAPDEAGQMTLDFGRYTGMTLRQIARQDPDYLRWLIRHSSGIRYRNAIEAVLPDARYDPYSTASR